MTARIATTHVDLQGDRLTLEALRGMADQINRAYIPALNEHDFRQPLGRTVSARVELLPDGEHALETTSEYWDASDTPESVKGDGRSIHLQEPPTVLFAVGYDRGATESEFALLNEMARLAGDDQTPQRMEKKALDPARTLEILVAFSAVAIAKGFLEKLGHDVYDGLKGVLVQLFRAWPRPQTLRFRFWPNEMPPEVDVYVEDPSPADVQLLMESRFAGLDELVRLSLEHVPDAAVIVIRWSHQGFTLLHVFRRDAFVVGAARVRAG